MTAVELDAIEVAAEAGIHCLTLDTPFAVGAVNTYLIEDSPLTLVDCGPGLATTLVQLEDLLATRGYSAADLELLVISHQHIDHTGLAAILARRAGLEIACIDVLAPVLPRWNEHTAASDDYGKELLLAHGIEPSIAYALRGVVAMMSALGGPAPVDHALSDGGVLELVGHSFDVHHRPGHSPSDMVLFDRASRIAIMGDHLLSDISSNALIERPLGDWDGNRPKPLIEYRRSLAATREMDIAIGLGGHGVPVLDHRALIDRRIADQDRRAEHFYELLADGPLSAHELATLRWGKIAITQAFLTLSEVLGHLDLLIADGRVAEDSSGDVIRFERTA